MSGRAGTEPLRVRTAPNPSPMTLDGTRTYLLGRARPVVIDPGPALDEHLNALLDALQGAAPAAILLTHAHPDHAAGAPELARRTGAPVCMARGALDASIAADAVDRWLEDGEPVETDVGGVRAVATPGHAPEHLCFHWTGEEAPAGGALFVGDLFMGGGDTTLVAPPEGDLTRYLHSLDRVERLRPGVLLPAHGPALEDPAEAVRRYRRHREERIEQVRRARAAAPGADAAELVRRVYGDELHPMLRAAAQGSVEAVLRHLDGETR